jgi:hypothetical protein
MKWIPVGFWGEPVFFVVISPYARTTFCNFLASSVSQQEQVLKQILRSRPCDVQKIEALRKVIRDAYVELLFHDPAYASGKDMDQSLWKTCFYRKIEEFRKQIRRLAAAASSVDNKASCQKARAELHDVCTAFGDFIADAIGFYQDLMGRYERLYATQRDVRPPEAEGDESELGAVCVRSIHRCLIFLGDLARYRELHSEATRKDWTEAEKCYHRAIDTMPTSGNPHNQLAVLATYTEAECVAVYRYCRAVLCASPFPTAKENLALLFEKNRQKIPDPSTKDGAQILEEEGRIRDGLAAGTITGQQAGIARATMLKSFLLRFVRLHGILFRCQQRKEASSANDEGGDEGVFPTDEALRLLHTTLVDLQQLLKMSAFGDGLLLQMVAICVFSVVTSWRDGQDPETVTEESSAQVLSLSLAVGLVAEIAACVRTTCQSEHTTAKPPGSRLLGPVVVFCDWLASRPALWRLRPLDRSRTATDRRVSEKEAEAAVRENFWRAVGKVGSELQPHLPTREKVQGKDTPQHLVWTPQDGRVLKEQHDIRGFEPLHAIYGAAFMTRPKPELARLEVVSDELAATWRTLRLLQFLKSVGVQSGAVGMDNHPTTPGCWLFTCNGRENVFALSYPDQVAGQHIFGSAGLREAQGTQGAEGTSRAPIGFKPSFISPSGAGGHLDASHILYLQQQHQLMVQQQQLLPQHQRLPSLDDSSQLPKEMVEAMVGSLLDCSDSGPRPPYAASCRPLDGSGLQGSAARGSHAVQAQAGPHESKGSNSHGKRTTEGRPEGTSLTSQVLERSSAAGLIVARGSGLSLFADFTPESGGDSPTAPPEGTYKPFGGGSGVLGLPGAKLGEGGRQFAASEGRNLTTRNPFLEGAFSFMP